MQGVEIGEIGQHEEERDQRNGPSPVERGGRTAARPPEDADDDRHQAEQIEVAPALHEDRVEARHDIFVVQSAYDGGQSRHRDTEYPDVVTEIDPFAAARTAQQEEREEGQHDAGPLAGVEPLAEDEHGADKHHDGARGIDRTDDGNRQVFHGEIAENPRSEDDDRFKQHQSVRPERARRGGQYRAVEPPEAALGRDDHRQQEKRREEGVEQQHRKHRIPREGLLLGRIVKAQQRGGGEGEGQPHNANSAD